MKNNPQLLSPKKYIAQRARSLTIGKCYITADIEMSGEALVIVQRLHTGNNMTVGIYMIDTFCRGLRDSLFKFRISHEEFDNYFGDRIYSSELKEISYNEAHNWIYGAIAWAEDAGLEPHPSFNLTSFILEEDTEEIPFIDLPFGKNGKHFFFAESSADLNRHLPILKENLGDDFDYVVQNSNDTNIDDIIFDDEK